MKFLVTSKPKHMVPPEVSVALIDAMGPWASKYAAKFDQIWGFAGIAGGGAIVNVNSLEELDAMMAEFPMGGLSEMEISPITDLEGALQRAKQALEAFTKAGS